MNIARTAEPLVPLSSNVNEPTSGSAKAFEGDAPIAGPSIAAHRGAERGMRTVTQSTGATSIKARYRLNAGNWEKQLPGQSEWRATQNFVTHGKGDELLRPGEFTEKHAKIFIAHHGREEKITQKIEQENKRFSESAFPKSQKSATTFHRSKAEAAPPIRKMLHA